MCMIFDHSVNKNYVLFLILLYLLIDICCREDTAEVELVSLIEEHIPHYKLRADTLTQFGGE